MELLKERWFSFFVVFATYILAAVVGISVYNAIALVWWQSLLIADIASTVVVFIFSCIFNNSSVYDPYWSVQPIIILFAFAVNNKVEISGAIILFVVTIWGIRLTANWAYTFQNLTWQDWRYTMIKEKTGKIYPLINFLGIHLFPTLVVYLCILPATYVILTNPPLTVWLVLFSAFSLFGATVQGIADFQMHKFRRNRTGNFIRTGLWKNSRHPNYLGEIIMWWGMALACVLSIPNTYYFLIGALVNTLMFLFVSIPMADKRQSRKEGFSEYKMQTRMLLPIKK